jgi:hypothetical protein
VVLCRRLVLSVAVALGSVACSIPDDPFPVLETPPPPDGEPAPPDAMPMPPDGDPELPDAPAFAVLSVTPGDGDVDVAPDVAITVQFTAKVDPATLEHLHVDDVAGAPVPGAWSASDDTATFRPERRLGSVRRYTISASTELRDVTGRPLSTALAAGFTTRDVAWSAPVMAQSSDGHLAVGPMVVCHADGAVDVAWTEWAPLDAGKHVVVRRHAAGAWGEAIIVSHERARATLQGLAVNRRGGVAAAWTDDATRVVGASRLRAGSPWEDLGTRGVPAVGERVMARVGLSDGDDVALFWRAGLGPMAARFTTDAGWALDVPLRDRVDVGGVDLAVSAGGGAAAAWTESRGLVTRVFDPGPSGGWRAEDDPHAPVAYGPGLGSDASGNLTLIWLDRDGAVQGRHRAAAGPWQETLELGRGSYHQLAVGAAGTAAATWRANDSGRPLAVRLYRPGAGWDSPRFVEFGGLGDHRVAVSGEEVTVVGAVYDGADAHAAKVLSVRNVGGQWQQPIELDAGATSGSASVAACPDGSAVAVWSRHVADGRGTIWMSRFE